MVFDPKLTIDGGEIASIHSQPMRYLGKLVFEDQAIRQSVKGKLKDMLKATEKSQRNGIMKMWIYNNEIIPKMIWEFTIYNFLITYVENLEAVCTRYLKRWAGISRCTNNTALNRSRKKYGLQLKRLTTSVKCMQVAKYHLNKHSVDGSTQALYKECIQKKAISHLWRLTVIVTTSGTQMRVRDLSTTLIFFKKKNKMMQHRAQKLTTKF